MSFEISKFGYDLIIRDIPGYPNYQIAEDGTVYNKITGKEMKIRRDTRGGYLTVGIFSGSKQKSQYVHRLLALTFIDNHLNKSFVDHINRVRVDNRLENLRWVTRSENCHNIKTPKSNTSGATGIYCCEKINKYRGIYNYWCAFIYLNYKKYETTFPYTDEGFEQACKFRKELEEKYHTIL